MPADELEWTQKNNYPAFRVTIEHAHNKPTIVEGFCRKESTVTEDLDTRMLRITAPAGTHLYDYAEQARRFNTSGYVLLGDERFKITREDHSHYRFNLTGIPTPDAVARIMASLDREPLATIVAEAMESLVLDPALPADESLEDLQKRLSKEFRKTAHR